MNPFIKNSMVYDIDESVYERIKKHLISPEQGGILGVNACGVVTEFYCDTTGLTTQHMYVPDVDILNKVIYEWAESGIAFVGFVHSHPKTKRTLSNVDKKHAHKIKKHCNISKVLMLIYIPDDNTFWQFVV